MLSGFYDPALVLVSLLVAVLASYTALNLAERVSSAAGAAARWWVAGGALAMGTGIWSMHFIGMLAFRLPIPLGYDLGITLLSWLLPIAVSAAALWLLGGRQLRWPALAGAAVLLGLGINAMHYVGMAALRMDPGIVYDPGWVAASVVIAIVAAGAALWIGFHLRGAHAAKVWRYRALAAGVMGLAIVGMHYTGMAAAGFPEGSICRAATGRFTLTQLAMLVTLGTVGLLAIALLTAVYDARLESRNLVLAMAEQTAHERQTLLDRERALRVEAERVSALKDEFLATLSHELRTPLNAVLGWVQILRARNDAATLARGVETIERNARLQARLIDDLLDMSRIVSGRVRLELAPVDLAAAVQAAAEAAKPAAQAKGIVLELVLSRRDLQVQADATRLQQVLWNLLSNAIKFTPERGRVTLTLRGDERQAEIEVSDTGQGIAPEFLAHVFERFRQADASTTRRHGGLGLGLAIVRELVELHGGRVAVRSAGLGAGATFLVELPLQQGGGVPAPPPPASAMVPGPPAELKGLQVLVVDDERDAREMLQDLLGALGAQVTTAAGAADAMQAIERQRPELLISDIGMPDIDGYALIRQLRASADPQVASVKAIALTAFTRRQDRDQALQAGFDAYVPKPVDWSTLEQAISQVLAVPPSRA